MPDTGGGASTFPPREPRIQDRGPGPRHTSWRFRACEVDGGDAEKARQRQTHSDRPQGLGRKKENKAWCIGASMGTGYPSHRIEGSVEEHMEEEPMEKSEEVVVGDRWGTRGWGGLRKETNGPESSYLQAARCPPREPHPSPSEAQDLHFGDPSRKFRRQLFLFLSEVCVGLVTAE